MAIGGECTSTETHKGVVGGTLFGDDPGVYQDKRDNREGRREKHNHHTERGNRLNQPIMCIEHAHREAVVEADGQFLCWECLHTLRGNHFQSVYWAEIYEIGPDRD